ncbi:cysteine dioxygenase [Fictibacillus halophilus]|uniref:Cysteine dioxygenase n=1 Tax=Fictibacillus halophilus TaxID=1610490 RepID=A0ABV2LDP3_9BACL|nr:cysteine dioxygenase family protein [Fictibacillus halophilus]
MDILQKIERVFSTVSDIDRANAANIMLQLSPTFQDVEKHLSTPQDLEYGRNVLFKNERVEVLLVFLPPFSKTLVHDHGFSSGWIYVVEGSVLNLLYRKGNDGVSYERSEYYPKGELFSVEGDTTHAMYNPTFSATVTLHIYSPPLGTGKVYKPHE